MQTGVKRERAMSDWMPMPRAASLVLPLVVLTALTVGACQPMAWTKPGATPELAQIDQHECSRLASQTAFRDYFHGGPFFYPFPDRWHRRSHFYRQQREFDRMSYEAHLQDYCMRTRGYELVPIGPG